LLRVTPLPAQPSLSRFLCKPDDFELLQCTINGQPQTIERRKGGNNRLFTVTPNSVQTNGYIDVTYTHRTLVSQHGHQLFIDFATTKGLRLDLTYTPECDIRHVNVLPYIASPTQPRVERSPHGIPNPSISLDFGDAWTFPDLASSSPGYSTAKSHLPRPRYRPRHQRPNRLKHAR
jgi:hypothetical protein